MNRRLFPKNSKIALLAASLLSNSPSNLQSGLGSSPRAPVPPRAPASSNTYSHLLELGSERQAPPLPFPQCQFYSGKLSSTPSRATAKGIVEGDCRACSAWQQREQIHGPLVITVAPRRRRRRGQGCRLRQLLLHLCLPPPPERDAPWSYPRGRLLQHRRPKQHHFKHKVPKKPQFLFENFSPAAHFQQEI